ncbi:FMN reductase [Microtetraspora sp. NBRC 13810]|uniref:NADPH-dependent FMN reductase n=1 Tax=Microtetraspora sp. NBRC 13810 TaxID=3030990 RepID=UPI0024A3B1FB|nr:NAD(P)H-dependent oxidoreductase [Microtetraspora sp. NBRC 13810]GLW07372.1 FMN reductase [Microtetraspora sp. NBRC 13810]
MKIAIVVGSTRPGRKAETIARWVRDIAAKRGDAEYDILDIADYDLPLFDEPMPPALGGYTLPHSHNWAATIASYDGFVFVTPEYNHGPSGALKNALDFLFAEWNHKAAAFVGYGASGGVRAVEHLRLVLANLAIAAVRPQVELSLFHDFAEMTTFTPGAHQEEAVTGMLDDLVRWTGALKTVRESAAA